MTSTLTDRIYGESASVAVKAPCLAAAVTPIALSGLASIAGYAPNSGDRILVMGQADSTTNGIYNASTGAWARSGDFDGAYDAVQGTLVVVLYPNAAGLIFQLITPNPVIGSTALNFASYANLNPNAFFPPATPAEVAAGIVVVAAQYAPGQLNRYLVNAAPGATPMDAALASAIAQAQQTGGAPVTVADRTLLANNATVPAGVPLHFTGNGSVTLTTGKTLTINGPFFSTPTRQVFLNAQAGQGAVIFAQGTCEKAYAEWWGAKADSTLASPGTDCTAAIAACITATSGGAGLNIGLIPIQLLAGYYLTGNQVFTPASIVRGVGRKECGYIAKTGTSGIWLTDNGNAAGIIMEDFAQYAQSATCPTMTDLIKFGYGVVGVHGSEGYLKGLWPRDCACYGGGWHLDIKQNIGFYDLISVYGNAAQSAGSNLVRIQGVGGMASKIVALGAGANAYSAYLNSAGIQVTGLEIEAPNSCSSSFAPLSIQQNAFLNGVVISANNSANTTFDHLWEVGASATTWRNDVQLFQATGAFMATVTNGNGYNIAKNSYFGGTLQLVVGNT